MMKKEWLWCLAVIFLLTGCPSTDRQPPTVYTGPTGIVTGVEPKSEPYSPTANRDYTMNGVEYHIINDPQNYSQQGLASWYGEEQRGNHTATGEAFDPYALAAAHPTLPIPSYVRITNLNNGRRLVVRVNDRGPFIQGRIIELTKGVADRLNLSTQSPIQVDFISVAPDGTLSGPGSIGTEFARQSFDLPARPEIATVPSTQIMHQGQTEHTQATQATAPQPQQVTSQGADPVAPQGSSVATQPATASQATPVAVTPSGPGWRLQVGALHSETRAHEWQKELSQQFSLPGRVKVQDGLYRVQLGPFPSREEAGTLREKLAAAQITSFIVAE